MSITFTTAWYIMQSKFDCSVYETWIANLLTLAANNYQHFNLVVYSDETSSQLLLPYLNSFCLPNVKLILKPMTEFFTYRYKPYWIFNHRTSNLDLHTKTDWQLNMLWNEKVFLVQNTIANKDHLFDTTYYGWIDIGYFRNRSNDTHTDDLLWPNTNVLQSWPFTNGKIHYACVQNDINVFQKLLQTQNRTKTPSLVPCFAGGFFLLKPDNISTYTTLYQSTLEHYFSHRSIIKDDQTIIQDIIFNNAELFYIHVETNPRVDNWFMFQRILR